MTEIPKNPTDGWLASELERLGIVVRGTDLYRNPKRMRAILRERGYPIEEPARRRRKEPEPEGER